MEQGHSHLADGTDHEDGQAEKARENQNGVHLGEKEKLQKQSVGQNSYCEISLVVIQRMSLCSSICGVPSLMKDYSSEADFRKSVDECVRFYNEQRPHQTLAYKSPIRGALWAEKTSEQAEKIDFSLNPLRHNDSRRKADAGEGKASTLLFAGIDFYQSFMDLFCVPD